MRACDYNIYRINYSTTFPERVPTFGGMDSDPTGNQITEERNYLVVAPTDDLARAAFKRYHSRDTCLMVELIGQLDDLVYLQ